jgi:hypothetical protein
LKNISLYIVKQQNIFFKQNKIINLFVGGYMPKTKNENESKLVTSDYRNKWWFTITADTLPGLPGIYCAYPFKACEKRRQMGASLPLSPKLLFKGSTGYAGTFLATLTTQYTIKNIMNNNNFPTNTIFSAALCGAASGPFAAVAENLIVRQHSSNLGLRQAIKSLANESYMRFFRSTTLLCGREAIFAPTNFIISRKLGEQVTAVTGKEWTRLPAEVSAGILAAFLSHPLERVATTIQKLNSSISVAYRFIIKNQGYGGFLTGAGWRAGVVSTAIVVINHPYTNRWCNFFLEKLVRQEISEKSYKYSNSLQPGK